MIKVSDINTNPNNPRIIKDGKFEKLKQSIQQLPKMLELRPIVVDDNNTVLGGNMRLRALIDLGYTEIPDEWVKSASELTEEERQRFIIVDNLGYGEWDWDILENEWDAGDLNEWGLDTPDDWIDNTIEDEESFVIEEITKPKTVLGDLYELFSLEHGLIHRVQCGDSTDPDVVTKTLSNKEPYIMVTDPPYGVKYDPTWRHEAGIIDSSRKGKVQNDDIADWSPAWSLSPSRVAYVWHGAKHTSEVQNSLELCDYQIRSQIIWNKQQMVFSRGDYHWKHEPCWYAVKKGNKGNWAGDRKQTTVWDIQSILQSSKVKTEDSAQVHGTQKPVECMARPIRNHDGDVYDPFLGSGTTVIAAEQTGRNCYGQELDECYVDIIVRRWVKYMIDKNKLFKVTRNGEEITNTEWIKPSATVSNGL